MVQNTITFNSDRLFGIGQHTVLPKSWQRATKDEAFAGLNGVLSVDMGRRGRKIVQQGSLSAKSVKALTQMMDAITAYINGQAYELVDENGCVYSAVRMDHFQIVGNIKLGHPVSCAYEIEYTQLGI